MSDQKPQGNNNINSIAGMMSSDRKYEDQYRKLVERTIRGLSDDEQTEISNSSQTSTMNSRSDAVAAAAFGEAVTEISSEANYGTGVTTQDETSDNTTLLQQGKQQKPEDKKPLNLQDKPPSSTLSTTSATSSSSCNSNIRSIINNRTGHRSDDVVAAATSLSPSSSSGGGGDTQQVTTLQDLLQRPEYQEKLSQENRTIYQIQHQQQLQNNTGLNPSSSDKNVNTNNNAAQDSTTSASLKKMHHEQAEVRSGTEGGGIPALENTNTGGHKCTSMVVPKMQSKPPSPPPPPSYLNPSGNAQRNCLQQSLSSPHQQEEYPRTAASGGTGNTIHTSAVAPASVASDLVSSFDTQQQTQAVDPQTMLQQVLMPQSISNNRPAPPPSHVPPPPPPPAAPSQEVAVAPQANNNNELQVLLALLPLLSQPQNQAAPPPPVAAAGAQNLLPSPQGQGFQQQDSTAQFQQLLLQFLLQFVSNNQQNPQDSLTLIQLILQILQLQQQQQQQQQQQDQINNLIGSLLGGNFQQQASNYQQQQQQVQAPPTQSVISTTSNNAFQPIVATRPQEEEQQQQEAGSVNQVAGASLSSSGHATMQQPASSGGSNNISSGTTNNNVDQKALENLLQMASLVMTTTTPTGGSATDANTRAPHGSGEETGTNKDDRKPSGSPGMASQQRHQRGFQEHGPIATSHKVSSSSPSGKRKRKRKLSSSAGPSSSSAKHDVGGSNNDAVSSSNMANLDTLASVGAMFGAASASTGTRSGTKNGRSSKKKNGGIPLYLDSDPGALTEYQCLLRQQIQVFEATEEDIQGSAQGRNVPILLGQVGIRCRHCAPLPLKSRPRGAVYFSKTIAGVYQVGQNMAKQHIVKTCQSIPNEIREKLKYLQAINRRASGGKEYWSKGLQSLGVYEDGHIMRLHNTKTKKQKKNPSSADHDDESNTKKPPAAAT